MVLLKGKKQATTGERRRLFKQFNQTLDYM